MELSDTFLEVCSNRSEYIGGQSIKECLEDSSRLEGEVFSDTAVAEVVQDQIDKRSFCIKKKSSFEEFCYQGAGLFQVGLGRRDEFMDTTIWSGKENCQKDTGKEQYSWNYSSSFLEDGTINNEIVAIIERACSVARRCCLSRRKRSGGTMDCKLKNGCNIGLDLHSVLSYGLSEGSWGKYHSVLTLWKSFARENVIVSLDRSIEEFILYLLSYSNDNCISKGYLIPQIVPAFNFALDLEGKDALRKSRNRELIIKGALSIYNDVFKEYPVTPRILQKLLDVKVSQNGTIQLIWSLALLLLIRLLLRIGELLKLQLKDIKILENRVEIRVWRRKTKRKKEWYPILKNGKLAIARKLILLKRFSGLQDEDFIFDNRIAKLTPAGFNEFVKEQCKLLGIKERITSHSFRIGGASIMVSSGVSVNLIKTLGGWSSDAVDSYLHLLADVQKVDFDKLLTS